MSVEVKTPTKTQFEHVEFQCGEKTPPGNTGSLQDQESGNRDQFAVKPGYPRSGSSSQMNQSRVGSVGRKRRISERAGTSCERGERSGSFGGPYGGKKKAKFGYGKGREKIVLPSKFLLGGNINDPLNLNSLCDDKISAALNSLTPQSSPLQTPAYRHEVQVMLPPNISDPLNLNCADNEPVISSSRTKKKRHKKKRRSTGENASNCDSDISKPLHIDTQPGEKEKKSPTEDMNSDAIGQKLRHIVDKIVSPVIPQSSPKGQRRKRTQSEGESSKPEANSHCKQSCTKSDKDKTSPKVRLSRQGSNQKSTDKPTLSKQKTQSKPHKKFIYGNYNRYYGYRNPDSDPDHRLNSFRADWFEGKDVLDIGCNVGHLTLYIAKNFRPKHIVGIDIDGSLIASARRNIRHYVAAESSKKYPASMPVVYGPVAAPNLRDGSQTSQFPNNITFTQGSYVLDTDLLLDLQVEEYDTILCLSITKWIHLNWGDDGLKRTFKRIYRQLRTGGHLILEPQGWASYKKKKNLSECILKNFKSIKFKPDQFTEFLLSKEVGFSTCALVDVPFNKSKGFQRPIQVFTKGTNSLPGTAQNTPNPSYSNTPGHSCSTPEQSHHLYCPTGEAAATPEVSSSDEHLPCEDI